MAQSRVEETYPLSPMQQGILYDALYQDASGIDVEQIVCTLPEAVDADLMRQAWARVQQRHSSLRTTLRWQGLDRPVQDVLRTVPLDWTVRDWRDRSPEVSKAELERYLHADRKRGFALDQAPLTRVALFRVADCEYRMVWTCHHAIIDGRSFSIVLKDVFAIFEALRDAREPALQEAPQYRQFIEWLEERDASEDEPFWRNRLEGFEASNGLEGFEPSEKVEPSTSRKEKEVLLSVEATSALVALGERQGFTLNNIVQGAWGLVLSRYSGRDDVTVGVVRAVRRNTLDSADSIVGVLINTYPVNIELPSDDSTSVAEWLKGLRLAETELGTFVHTSLADIKAWTEMPPGAPLFETLIIFDYQRLDSALRSEGGFGNRRFELHEQTNYPLTLYGYGEQRLCLKIAYDAYRFHDSHVENLLEHLVAVLEAVGASPEIRPRDLPLFGSSVKRSLAAWNDTGRSFPSKSAVHVLIEEQVERTPDAVAVACGGEEIPYHELDRRANQLAHYLIGLGVGPDVLVGVFFERTIPMVVAVLGVLKAGGAYVPLDPEYPRERLRLNTEDSGIGALLTQGSLREKLPQGRMTVVDLETEWDVISRESTERPQHCADPHDLAYVIYTSGSTGRPNGVMIEHANVVNFIFAMDQVIEHESPGVWLAVTSLSFDISVLELLWTLARGFKVVLYTGADTPTPSRASSTISAARKLDLSLFYFASNEEESGEDKYRLLLEGAKFADRNGLAAIWTPERHFHAFGGLYPNPAVTSAAIAAVTDRIAIRAGSVVSPLHHPLRIAEEWSVVDNLSRGRVGISFASGWHPQDFVLQPSNYKSRKQLMFEGIETIRKLWRGQELTCLGPNDEQVSVGILPRPVQGELPVWVTAAGNPETFRLAGEVGASILTHMLGQTKADLQERIAAYRAAWKTAGHPGNGYVTLMLHTFVGDEEKAVKELVREPMKRYLASSMDLMKLSAGAWPALKTRAQEAGRTPEELLEASDLSREETEALLEFSFERFYNGSALFGTVASCSNFLDELLPLGVDEVACLIDFGVDTDVVLRSLPNLRTLQERYSTRAQPSRAGEPSLADLIESHGVTHLQCTPSMLNMFLMDERARRAVSSIEHLFVGGEAFPRSLAASLEDLCSGTVTNMYGPTETTIWSATHLLDGSAGPIPIGRPIANTEFHVLDKYLRPVPLGVHGELYIGGAGVARGYLGNPKLTTERFIENPIGKERGGRLYWTGDVVRYRLDGALEFVGRIDQQVKVRGHRIELEEIESVLNKHPSVKRGIVSVHEDASGDKRLVAYLIRSGDGDATASELRDFVKRHLPEFMAPAMFVDIDEVPVTPNFKVDRKKLPDPFKAGQIVSKDYLPPSTPTEMLLADIWTQTLGVENVSALDNFFDLGGHSLLAMKAMALLERRLGVRVDPRTIVTGDLRRIAAECDESDSRTVRADARTASLTSRVAHKFRRALLGD